MIARAAEWLQERPGIVWASLLVFDLAIIGLAVLLGRWGWYQ